MTVLVHATALRDPILIQHSESAKPLFESRRGREFQGVEVEGVRCLALAGSVRVTL